ncbi:MAG TPA: 50S ribosomal protein L6 [bacterium]|jgi:large subunit ribosomal protein L6|nr:50S ribosomal protein L6 [bacterium]HOG38075.1 50S ribosomal protein L6 [bacterium]HQI03131.1 50S ribosomal protein L6 [bacterium]
MSRIGKQPVIIPEGVTVQISDGSISVSGKKGKLQENLVPGVNVVIEENKIIVSVKDPEDKKQKARWGLQRSLINNMVNGVTNGYEKKLEVNGVGYRVALQGKKLILNVGFSHPVEYNIPETVEAVVEKNTITLTSFDKRLLGQTAAEIRSIKKPEPYKGKGIKYSDEVIRRKAGKVAGKGA